MRATGHRRSRGGAHGVQRLCRRTWTCYARTRRAWHRHTSGTGQAVVIHPRRTAATPCHPAQPTFAAIDRTALHAVRSCSMIGRTREYPDAVSKAREATQHAPPGATLPLELAAERLTRGALAAGDRYQPL